MSLFKSDKCKKCKHNPGHRFCLRIVKNICWKDCNDLRIDRKCPHECSYAIKEANDLSLQTKADSILEYTELLKMQIDIWVSLPQPVFGNDTPRFMAETEEGRARLIEFFNQFKVISLIPLSYLKDKLSLSNLKVPSRIDNYEDTAVLFIENIIIQKWEKTIDLLLKSSVYKSKVFFKNYTSRISENKFLKKVTDYFIVSSALSKDKKKALVYMKLNAKYDLTISFAKQEDSWLIADKVFGKPEIINSESQAMQQIAVFLSKNKLSDAFELLQKYSSIYVDSSDLNYYWGMYYMISKNEKKAFGFMQTAVELDPDFWEAKGIYATMLVQKNEIEAAKKLYLEIIAINPQDIKSINNLASIYISEDKKTEAKKLLAKCLQIDPNFEYAKKNLEKL